jgi:hypothetical protein
MQEIVISLVAAVESKFRQRHLGNSDVISLIKLFARPVAGARPT